MTTLTVTKTNYAQLIDQINDMLFREKKIVVNIDTFDRIQKLYDNAKDEHKKGKTLYGGEVVVDAN